MPPPIPPRRETAHLTRGECASAMRGRDFYSRRIGEGGRGKRETVPFVNGSSYQLKTQNQDSQYHSAPLFLRQDVSISFWWPLATSAFLYSERIYKREPDLAASPQSTTLCSTVNPL
jgi:hypothetical protein